MAAKKEYKRRILSLEHKIRELKEHIVWLETPEEDRVYPVYVMTAAELEAQRIKWEENAREFIAKQEAQRSVLPDPLSPDLLARVSQMYEGPNIKEYLDANERILAAARRQRTYPRELRRNGL